MYCERHWPDSAGAVLATAAGHPPSRGRRQSARSLWSLQSLLLLLLMMMLVVVCRSVCGADDRVRYVGQSQDGVHDGVASDRKLSIGHRAGAAAVQTVHVFQTVVDQTLSQSNKN